MTQTLQEKEPTHRDYWRARLAVEKNQITPAEADFLVRFFHIKEPEQVRKLGRILANLKPAVVKELIPLAEKGIISQQQFFGIVMGKMKLFGYQVVQVPKIKKDLKDLE